MKKKSIISLALAGVLLLGMTGGCGPEEEEKQEDLKLTENGTYPIVEGDTPLEMSIFMPSSAIIEDYTTNDFSKYMEELTGIKMEYITPSGGEEASDTLNLMLQSDDYPDIIFKSSPDLARYGVEEQIIIPLDDYINEDLMPNYTKLIEENGYDLSITRETDGKIYSLANINDCYHCKYARKMWVNTYYLDQMGCEIPTTTEEFPEVCRKFLEFKPDGVAVTGAIDGWFFDMEDFLMGAYTFVPETSYTFDVKDYIALNSDTETFECVAVSDEYREGLKFMNQLYEMGAIYDGTFTQSSEQLKTLVNQADEPVLFFASGTITGAIDSATNNELYRHYECMAPLEGPDGTRIAYVDPFAGVRSGNFCITDNCESVEAALRWADYLYSPEGYLSAMYGPEEGVDWEFDPEGQVGLNGEPALYEIHSTYSAEAQNHDWQDASLDAAPETLRLGQATDIDVDPYAPEGLERLLYDVSNTLYEPYSKNTNLTMPAELKVTTEESNSVSTIAVEVENVFNQSQVAFITGEKDIDSDADWEAYLTNAENAGLSQLVDLYQTAYDRTHAE